MGICMNEQVVANSLLLDHFQKKESWNLWNVEQCHICKVQHPKKWSKQNRLIFFPPHFLWWKSHESVDDLKDFAGALHGIFTQLDWNMMCVDECSKCQEPRSFPCLRSADLKVHRAPGLNMMCNMMCHLSLSSFDVFNTSNLTVLCCLLRAFGTKYLHPHRMLPSSFFGI